MNTTAHVRSAIQHFRFIIRLLYGSALPVILLWGVLCCTPPSAWANGTQKVLVLHSYHQGYRWTDMIHEGLVRTLSASLPKTELYVEYMNTKRQPIDVMAPYLVEMYTHLYQKVAFDVVVASDNNALDFLLQYRDTLFPGAAVVFCGINDIFKYQFKPEAGYTGVAEDLDIESTVNIALKLHLDTKKIALITDATETGLINLGLARKVAASHPGIEFIELHKQTAAQLSASLKQLGNDTLVFALSFFRDAEGRAFSARESMDFIVAASPRPVYTVWDFYMAPGAVGGKLLSGRLQGENAAAIVVRILKGEKSGSIPVVASPTAYMFDYAGLQKFGISETQLPQGSLVTGRPDTFYSRYVGYIWSGIALFSLQIVIIGLLLWNISRRRKEETSRKAAQDEARESNEMFSLFMQHSPVYVFIKEVTREGSRVLQASENFAQMVGIPGSKMIGRTMEELFPADFAAKITADDRAVIAGGKVLKHEEELNGRSYTTIKFPLVKGDMVLLAGYTIDTTERKQAEEERESMQKQLLHAQKLESLGVLAGGIAHDFNNLLMAIMGNADLALMRLNPESPAVGNLHAIEQASARAADLAKQMLAYSGKGKFVVESLDLNRLLEEMLHMLEVSISKKAILRLNQYQPLPPVEADATQMRQIVMNLVINASEAIGDKSGVIAITTGCMDCDRSYLKDVWLDENLTDGLYVYLEIADTGCGMDKETLAKLFDPFFTTKFTGRGLGMAAVLGIIRGHKGAIKVYSEPGKGTTFKVLLPASGKPAELFNGKNHTDHWQGSGTVLLVDDEETVRGIGVEMLKELGFNTITANDGREAVEQFKNNPAISFVILDLTMPHMDGEQCFRELRKMKPDVKVIMSSGFSEDEVTGKFVGKGLAGFIQKPYKLSVLKEAIRGMNTLK